MRKCPRCGSAGSPYVDRGYLYFAHRGGGKCYIGPTAGYKHAARLYEVEMLHAFEDGHKLEVLLELLEYFSSRCAGDRGEACERLRRELEKACREDHDRSTNL